MAEPPSSEGQPPRPPPVPGRRAAPPPVPPVRPATAGSANTGDGDDDASEPTRPVSLPGSAALVDDLVTVISTEAEALITEAPAGMSRDDADALLADLNVRLALFAADVLDDADAAARHLDLAERHPLAPRLFLSRGITGADADSVERAVALFESNVADEKVRASGLRDVAEAWLYRFSEAGRAAEIARNALDLRSDPAIASELQHIYMLALARAGEWAELGAGLADAATDKRADLETIAEAVHLLVDRLDDPGQAAELLSSLLKRVAKLAKKDAASAVRAHRIFAIALDAALLAPDAGLAAHDVLTRQLGLVETDPEAAPEAAALRFRLAQALEDDKPSKAREGYAVAAAACGSASGFGVHLAAMACARVAGKEGKWGEASAALRELAERPGSGSFAASHRFRAAEILDARGDAREDALALWRAVAASGFGGKQAERAIECLLLDGPGAELASHLEVATAEGVAARASKRRAAAVVESRQEDLDNAARLLQAATEGGANGLVAEREHLARVFRRKRDHGRLAEIYRLLAEDVGERRASAALWCAAGAIEVFRGSPEDAEQAFATAARLGPKDATARFALATIYRRAERWKELAQTLGELRGLVSSSATEVALLRELGQIYADKIGDARRARTTLEKALELDPEDGDTLHALAALYDLARDWDKAIDLRERAVSVHDDAGAKAALLMEIGRIAETKKSNADAALDAYRRAFEIDPTSVEALTAQAALHRKAKRSAELLEVLRAELALDPDSDRRLAIQLEIGELTGEGEVDVEAALSAYQDALAVDPSNETALAGIRRIAVASERWEIVAGAFRTAPKTPENLVILAEALEKLEEWRELADVRTSQVEQAGSPADVARLAHGLAEIYETRLDDVDRAIEMYERAAVSGGVDATASQRALTRLLEANRRWPELTAALERELASVPAEDGDRQVGILLRLGELREGELGKPGEAALAYEAVLERQPQHVPSLQALEQLYEKLDREKDLLRVLEGRAAATEDDAERAELYTRIAGIKQKRSDADGAVLAYRDAFKANPSDRSVFTEMEKLCYKHERWTEVMDLYDTAIALVESKTSRAYRLGDLYARRGQVQLQYLNELGEAAASYLKVIELDPDNDTAVKFLESIFSQQEDWSGLIQAYEKRAELTGDDERRLETLRRAARVAGAKLKDPAEAARIYELILAVDATDRESLDALERFHDRAQDWDKLVAVLTMRLESAPAGDATTALLKRIAQICEEGLRDHQRAIDNYLRILEIAPGNKEALEALGRIYESTEQWAEFIDVTRRQIRVTTDRNVKALLYFKCGSVMEAKFGKEEDAIRYYDAAIKTSPSCLPAVHGLRDLYRRRQDWPRVIQTLELEVKLWQDDKERAGVFAQIGRIYGKELGQPERAMHYFESALAVDPECLPANKALFEHYFDHGEWKRAQGLAQALAQKAMREGDPKARSEFYRRRGIVAQMNGDMRGAAESLIIALEIRPNNLEALEALGALAKVEPAAYDFAATYRELDKIYKKRDDARSYLARVRVAQAVMKVREGDLDAAEELYAEANDLAEGDFTILSALVDLHCDMRRWTHAVDAIVNFLARDPVPDEEIKLRAMMRQAAIHGDCEMDPHRAIAVLREIIRIRPTHQEAHYRLAQEQFLLGRYAEAKAAIDRLIELAAAPGNPLSPEELARYYYYLGRILEAKGDQRAAASQYRRAAEYDPGYAPPALALARRAVDAGDQRQAETLLINAAHAAMEAGGAPAAVSLQRGLARILLGSGDRPAAIEAYRGILNVEPDNASDRVALAEIYAVEDVPKAVSELGKVIDRDIRHAPAYRLLASYYQRNNDNERAARVLSVMEMLGFAEDAELGAAAKVRATTNHAPLRRTLDEDLRQQFLVTDATLHPAGEIFTAAAAEITALFPQPAMGENLTPIQTIDDPSFKVALADLTRLYGVDTDVYVGDNVPSGVVMLAYPRRILVIDKELLTEEDASRRYLLGWALEALRGGYALLFALTRRQKTELGSLLSSLLLSESDRAGPTNEFVGSLPRRAAKVIDRHAGKGRQLDVDDWIEGMTATAKRAGLFACDDFGAATRMIARLNGESLHVGGEGTRALGAVLGGPDLVRFYLADEYHQLREILSTPLPTATA